jgi:serine/threonine-protein kinase
MASSQSTADRINAVLADRYRIEREIGSGGMATVFLAEDLKHRRKVALKVLQPELSAVVGSDRFLAEIETTAGLQHPNILPLFDSGEADGLLFYVMPFVEGESLREKLDREKQLPVEEAVRIASDVAEALQAAHDQGIIHRDIKPANILLSGGKPLIADFGISLAVSAAGGGRLTETGLSLGTPHYMSPEQASADRDPSMASDVYSLGCVLFEMLVGEPPFTGATTHAVLAKVLTEEPASPSQLRRSIPGNVDAVIRRALEKLPADRFESAAALARALKDPGFQHGEAGLGIVPGIWKPIALGSTALAAALLLFLGWVLSQSQSVPPVSRLSVTLSRTLQVGSAWLTPDGASFLMRAFDPDVSFFEDPLRVRPRDGLESTPLRGTEGGFSPIFSPDGASMAFPVVMRDSLALRILPVNGVGPRTLLKEAGWGWVPVGMAWAPDGFLYLGSWRKGLRRVSEEGGAIEEVTSIDPSSGETGHVYPQMLPDGKTILFTVTGGPPEDLSLHRIVALDLGSGQRSPVVTGVFARYTPSGFLIYATAEQTIMAVPFDPETLALRGDPVMVADRVSLELVGDDQRFGGSDPFSVSEDGTLLFRPLQEVGPALPSWFTRSGEVTPVDSLWRQTISDPRISPSGDKVVMTVFDSVSQGRHVWVKDLAGGAPLKLTLEGESRHPTWTPDGTCITYSSNRDGNFDLWTEPADNSGPAVRIVDLAESVFQPEWSPDGEWLVFRTNILAPDSGSILAVRPGTDEPPIEVRATPGMEWGPRLSPDGRWLAFSSTESGRYQVYVVPFPDAGQTIWQVSTDEGEAPVWAGSGDALYFLNRDSRLAVASVRLSPTFGLGETSVIESGWGRLLVTPENQVPYDVSRDGSRLFLSGARMDAESELGGPAEWNFILVLNLFEELRNSGGGR